MLPLSRKSEERRKPTVSADGVKLFGTLRRHALRRMGRHFSIMHRNEVRRWSKGSGFEKRKQSLERTGKPVGRARGKEGSVCLGGHLAYCTQRNDAAHDRVPTKARGDVESGIRIADRNSDQRRCSGPKGLDGEVRSASNFVAGYSGVFATVVLQTMRRLL